MYLKVFLIALLSVNLCAFAQKSDTLLLHIEPAPNDIEVINLKTYLGHFEFEFRNGNKTQLKEYKLVDWMKAPYLALEDINIQNLSSISFLVGVDSNQILNGVMEGDLDPGNGMFWTWQAGYINLKLEYLEGKSQHDFHIGGYRESQNTAMRITIDIPPSQQLLGLSFQTAEFIEFIKSNDLTSVMSPGDHAVDISCHYAQFITPVWNAEDR